MAEQELDPDDLQWCPMRHCLPDETGQDLIREGYRLGLSCLRCPRSVVPEYVEFGVHERDDLILYKLTFVCSCGSRDVERFVLETPDDVDAFLQGARPHRAGSHNSVMKDDLR